MSFRSRVDEHRIDLNRSDLAIVDVLLSNPAEAALWRGEDVAARANVHPSAVTRTSKKLGYKGFLELRADLRDMHSDFLSGGHSSAADISGYSDFQSDGSVLGQLLATEIDALANAAKSVTQRDLDTIADLIAGSDRTFVYGADAGFLVAEKLEYRLRRYGIDVKEISGLDSKALAERVLSMCDQDVLVVIAFRFANKQLRQLLAHAHAEGCKIILITESLQLLSPIPDVVVSAARGNTDGFQSVLVPMTIADAIILTVIDRFDARVRDELDRLEMIARKLDT